MKIAITFDLDVDDRRAIAWRTHGEGVETLEPASRTKTYWWIVNTVFGDLQSLRQDVQDAEEEATR